ncbi:MULTISPECIES: hypothetical protein [Asticcacaulis]|jgi:hypothetical protein|uniref:Uncharacterized protein n=1 Tax=Asticcacaulis endophyticus TaxID=1395890 RepID=A0A918QAA1_9CAUL|nr:MULTISPECIES: hypothetical protein [Asticcacaulis]WKL56338.1 hypothetical protein Q1W73_11630 [Asticcacaulis sp. ZE23SCel15]GGZ39594.1 hypothetical protein GCM10011273_27760 [Asticcacaulis endophyticus]
MSHSTQYQIAKGLVWLSYRLRPLFAGRVFGAMMERHRARLKISGYFPKAVKI